MVRETEHADPVDILAEEFVERIRNGENPDVSDYAMKFPELEREIRELFPTLAMLEQAGNEVSRSGDRLLASPVVQEYIGDYRIIREIGRGGMGVVYEAEHHEMRRRVALKLLPTELASNPLHLRRFRREARAAGGLHHTNIVPVFDVGQDKGIYYYSMQFIRGQSLDLVIREIRKLAENGSGLESFGPGGGAVTLRGDGSIAERLYSGNFANPQTTGAEKEFPESSAFDFAVGPKTDLSLNSSNAANSRGRGHSYYLRVANLGLQIADALAYAHGQGVLHRDIKPANLLLDTSGTVWITDFGLARYDETELTRTGNIVGTLRYLAPERLNGHADARSDVYALGLTLYELCTLRPAFDENDRVQLVRQVTSENPTSPRRANPRIPRDLETIILKAIEKQPSQRYPSAGILAEDLKRFLSDRPLLSRRVAVTERCWRWCRRNPAIASLAGCVAALLTVVFFGAIWFGVTSRQQSRDLRHQTKLANGSEQRALSALYSARVAQARAARQSGRRGQRVDGLAAMEEAVSLVPRLFPEADKRKTSIQELRNEAIACLSNPDLGVARVWQVQDGSVSRAVFDSRLENYAQTQEDGTIVVRRVSDDMELARFPTPGFPAWALQFSPDGKFLTARYHPPRARVRELCIWNVLNSKKIFSERGEFQYVSLVFSHDSRKAFFSTSGPPIHVFDIEKREVDSSVVQIKFQPFNLGPDPTGDWLAVASAVGYEFELLNLRQGTTRLFSCPNYIMSFAWSDDGQQLAGACADGKIYRWDMKNLDLAPQVIHAHQAAAVELTFNHRGDRILSYGWDGNTRLWDLHSGSLLIAAEGMRFASTAFSPDDRRIGYHSNWDEFGIWDVHDKGPVRTLGAPGPGRWSMDFVANPKSRDLVLASSSEGLEIWNTTTNQRKLFDNLPKPAEVISENSGRALFVSHSKGILRVPYSVKDGLIETGEPETVSEPGPVANADISVRRMMISADGSSLAALIQDRIMVFDLTTPGFKAVEVGHHVGANQVAISPDGRWIVSTTWSRGSGVHVWDRLNRRMVVDLVPDVGGATAQFSPDGEWLAIGTGTELVLWETGTWNRKFSVDRDNDDNWTTSIAFSPDSSLFAGHYSRKAIQLVSTRTGERQAILETTEPGLIGVLRFNSSGNQLGSVINNKVMIWDLSELRRQLAVIGLDWANAPD